MHRQRFLEGPLGEGYDVVTCTECGAGFADGIPSQEVMDRYYSEQSRYTYDSGGGRQSPWDFKRFEATASQVVPHLRTADARILDIGCATGGLLSVLRARGYEGVTGVDPSPSCAAAAARLHGIKARAATLAQLHDWDERFDLILMVGILEHIREPAEALRIASRLLAPRGLLYCAVPDVEGLPLHPGAPFQQFSVEHVNFFSLGSLDRVMASCRLEPEETVRWTAEWRKGVFEPIASGVYRLGRASAPVFDSRTGPALARYVELSAEGDRSIMAAVEELRESREPILIWGAGTMTRRLLATSSLSAANIVAFVDSSTHLIGKSLAGRAILAPDQLHALPQRILVSSIVFSGEIVECIRHLHGLRNRVILLPGAPANPGAATLTGLPP